MKPNLEKITDRLEALEDTIIFKLLTRAQYKANMVIYKPGASGFSDHPAASLFDLRLRYQENIEAKFGRYTVPEEQPFTVGLPLPERSFLHSSGVDGDVNLTAKILKAYHSFVKKLCARGDDGHYGSSVEHDVYALQAVSERVHFGALYVAESKFTENPAVFRSLVAAGDRASLEAKITRQEVEKRILKRVEEKALHFQQGVNLRVRHFVDPQIIVDFYKNTIIPLTKEGEILHLFKKC